MFVIWTFIESVSFTIYSRVDVHLEKFEIMDGNYFLLLVIMSNKVKFSLKNFTFLL